jgi:hypothetical protein
MRRRSRAISKPLKARRRKQSTPKRRNAPKAIRNRGASIAGHETVVARLIRERDEALLRETANSEIMLLLMRFRVATKKNPKPRLRALKLGSCPGGWGIGGWGNRLGQLNGRYVAEPCRSANSVKLRRL